MTNQDYFTRIEELMRSLRDVSESITRERQQDERDNAEHRQERAEAARNGELGADWKEIQERIDKGETTLSDVFSGKDTSEAADALRQTAQQNIARAMRQAREEAEEQDEEDPFAALQESLAAMSEETQQRLRTMRGF
ncbi:hypothetical protein [Schaalia odontolytica]|uniref:hypothetical protein n=1 Tax=Schaalia odontolytica TaxID=1660 RepID=UPI0028D1EEB5|nr:hypothetical protein [Schaalia odontolytica]